MSLRRKIFIAFVLIIVLAGAGAGFWIQHEARDSYAHVVEEALVDMSQLFAAQIEQEMNLNSYTSVRAIVWGRAFNNFKKRSYSVKILNILKNQPALDVYVTDQAGIVVYSSREASEVGQDYKHWRDVALSLRGEYGARSTRLEQGDRRTSIYYVGAPLYLAGKIAGVVTVIKARASITGILDYFFQKIVLGLVFVVVLTIIFGGLLFVWVTRPIEDLKNYALNISKGNKAQLPNLPHRELKQLGDAFEEMRVSLEGRKTIERFIQSLIHELKSPLAAMRGSAELSLEPMAEAQRNRFLTNIVDESVRCEKVLEQLLGIATLESQTSLAKIQNVDLVAIIEDAQKSLLSIAQKNQVTFVNSLAEKAIQIQGDTFLLTQVFRNILQNAIEFSEAQSVVKVELTNQDEHIQIQISDSGSGIPEFAKNKIFEKFFSLERPRTGKKGTGLGLSFVREVILLHNGSISILGEPNGHQKGTRVDIVLPIHLKD